MDLDDFESLIYYSSKTESIIKFERYVENMRLELIDGFLGKLREFKSDAVNLLSEDSGQSTSVCELVDQTINEIESLKSK